MRDAIPSKIDGHAAPVTDWARPLHELRIAMLGELAEMGMDLARTVRDQAVRDGAEAPEQAVMAFGRAARAVRLTLMLQGQAIEALEARDSQAALESRYQASTARIERKAQIERIIGRVAERQDHDAHEVEHLVREASERLDEDDFYGDVLSRPISELVALICKDLDLDPDWSALAQELWAQEEIENGSPVWPTPASAPLTGSGPGRNGPLQAGYTGSSP